ncbi:glutamate racemase [Motilimonas pumila]|uniref:Glutamate racemase n=1 Tax=Motilimonas pumila TaxID=2303987 RepID=A0A418Y9I8_9GAMM|nr:glutamate racemase [Motilimonas pumila]RJG37554.1 glutamate racemase [Motilimonas pumila]
MNVLIFDSGVGGLSVVQQIQQHLPHAHMTYLFDNQFFPYGELAEEVLLGRVSALITQICQQQPIDMIVIACNSASTLVLEQLRQQCPQPIVGVVPAIKPAAALTQTGCIGLLATPGTVKRPYTANLVTEFAPHIEVKMLGSSELVQIAEAKLQGQPVSQQRLEDIIAPLKAGNPAPDVVILGCTHFPLLKEELQQAFGSKVKLIDSGVAIAKRVASLWCDKSSQVGLGKMYCTRWDKQTEQLKPAMLHFGFQSLSLFEVN